MIGKREMQKITMTEKLIRNENEAIEAIKANMPTSGYQMLRESLDMASKPSKKSSSTGKSERWKSAGRRWRSKRKRDLWSGLMERCIVLIVNMIIPV